MTWKFIQVMDPLLRSAKNVAQIRFLPARFQSEKVESSESTSVRPASADKPQSGEISLFVVLTRLKSIKSQCGAETAGLRRTAAPSRFARTLILRWLMPSASDV